MLVFYIVPRLHSIMTIYVVIMDNEEGFVLKNGIICRPDRKIFRKSKKQQNPQHSQLKKF